VASRPRAEDGAHTVPELESAARVRRVLILGRSARDSSEMAAARALRRRGRRVVLLNDNKLKHWGDRVTRTLLRGWVRTFRPHLVLVGKGLGLRPEVLREACAGRRSALWYHDIRVPPDPAIVERARQVDTMFLAPGGQAREYEALGVRRAVFLPEATDPITVDRLEPPRAAYASDVVFLGSGYDEYRADVLRRLARRFNLRVWGHSWERWGAEVGWTGRQARWRDFARVCASARIVLGISPSFNAATPVWGYSSNRMWRTLACGGFYLTHHTPGLDTLATDGEHCAFYRNEDHLHAQIERYLSDDAARERIRAAGRRWTLAHHTFDHRILNILNEEPFRSPLAAGGRNGTD
jgi:spore maturation protein CgeB